MSRRRWAAWSAIAAGAIGLSLLAWYRLSPVRRPPPPRSERPPHGAPSYVTYVSPVPRFRRGDVLEFREPVPVWPSLGPDNRGRTGLMGESVPARVVRVDMHHVVSGWPPVGSGPREQDVAYLQVTILGGDHDGFIGWLPENTALESSSRAKAAPGAGRDP